MKLRHTAALALVGLVFVGQATAQQPTAKPQTNPNWCSDVPASPNPPKMDNWPRLRESCINGIGRTIDCVDDCVAARELWKAKRDGRLSQLLPMTIQPNATPVPMQP